MFRLFIPVLDILQLFETSSICSSYTSYLDRETNLVVHAAVRNEDLLPWIIEWIEIAPVTTDGVSVDQMGDHEEADFHSIALEGERASGEDG